jgi:hypothetical protein
LLQRYAVRSLEGLGLLVFSAMVLERLTVFLWAQPSAAWLAVVLTLPLAYYLADLLTGLIHWICDSFGSERTPLWGPMLVGPFRRHHRDPLEITRISLLENLGASAIAGALILALWHPEPPAQSWPQLVGSFLGIWTIAFAVLSNLFHRWSHIPPRNKPQWMRTLQRYGLLLSTEAHMRHHKKPYRVNYCILSGWANPLSNRIPWTRLEAGLGKLGIPTNFD